MNILKTVVPEAAKIGMKLAMHPDDPQVNSIKGVERIMTSVDNFERMMKIYPSTYDIGFKGPLRPDHVPCMASDINDFPGYSNLGILFALGYIRGLMESISKEKVKN